MKIYLAAPLFTSAERLWNTHLAELLRGLNHAVWLPQENEPREVTAAGIFAMDVSGIDRSDCIVAVMDGPDPDSGTAWECGYLYGWCKALSIMKPIFTVRTDFRAIGEMGQTSFNIMLQESSYRIRLSKIFPTVEDVALAVNEALQMWEERKLADS
jgi:nucleoside 2-deoxyribosyltransferase